MRKTNELRLFISSTFRDLQEEREHLVKKIFPEIRALCRVRGVTFTDVDLRWGLTEEEANLGRIIRTCLEEVDKCRPYFIGIIGNRYGWVPELHDILMDPDLLTKYPFVEDVAIDGTSVTEMEFIHGVFDAPEVDGEYAFFYHRQGDIADDDDPERLGALIDRTRSTSRPFREFADVEELGNAVRDDLMAMIQTNWPDAEAPSELDLERRSHAAFAASRTRAYIPNPLYLKEFNSWLLEGDSPLVISGQSGRGKSSLVAYLTEYYHRKHPDAFVIAHYVGASPSSGRAISVIRHIVEAMHVRFGIEKELPTEPEALQKSFADRLFQCEHLAAREGIAVLIVIDAVNQLDVAGQRMSWLPKRIPSGVKFVISTTPGVAGKALADREWRELEVASLEDERIRQSIVVRYLGEFRKGISPEQLRRVIGDGKADSPLYLRVVAEELRLHGTHETLDDVIDRYGGAADLLGVFELVIERMERDYGEASVRNLLSFIGASRSGLGEDELLRLIDVSRLELSRLLFAFDYHLLHRDGQLSFFHDYLHRAVWNRYLSKPEDRGERYRRLASYFEEEPVSLRTTHELLHALEGLEDRPGIDQALSGIERFVGLWYPEPYEVLRLWSGRDRSEVVAAYETGLQRWKEVEHTDKEQVSALAAVGQVYERIGAWGEAEQITRQQMALLGRLGKRLEESRARSRLAELARMQGRFEESETLSREAEASARELGDQLSIAISVGNRGRTHFGRGEYSEALTCFQEQEKIARELEERHIISMAVGNRGIIHWSRGEYPEAISCYREQEKIAQELGDRQSVGFAVGNRGIIHSDRGDFAEALECYREQEKIARETDDRQMISLAVGNRAIVHLDRGDYSEALPDAVEALDIHKAFGLRHGATYWHICIAQCLLELHNRSEAMPANLPQFVPDATEDQWRSATLRAVRTQAGECLEISRELSMPETIFSAEIALARLAAAEGSPEAGVNRLNEMLSGVTDDEQRSELHYWIWKLDPNGTDHRSQALDLYRSLFAGIPKYIYRVRIDELDGHGDVPDHQTTSTSGEESDATE
ncbi:MAG: tetratricopeptide repeat protein [Ignavibacteria bacterium]|nr:tetratricopeptide repeat protein [Ignavibacteria bacterium]